MLPSYFLYFFCMFETFHDPNKNNFKVISAKHGFDGSGPDQQAKLSKLNVEKTDSVLSRKQAQMRSGFKEKVNNTQENPKTFRSPFMHRTSFDFKDGMFIINCKGENTCLQD